MNNLTPDALELKMRLEAEREAALKALLKADPELVESLLVSVCAGVNQTRVTDNFCYLYDGRGSKLNYRVGPDHWPDLAYHTRQTPGVTTHPYMLQRWLLNRGWRPVSSFKRLRPRADLQAPARLCAICPNLLACSLEGHAAT